MHSHTLLSPHTRSCFSLLHCRFQITLGNTLMKYGLEIATKDRRNRAAVILTKFIRSTATVHFAAKFLIKRLNGVRQSRKDASTSALVDTTNTCRRSTRRKVIGRPKKVKRRAGRPPATPVVTLVRYMTSNVCAVRLLPCVYWTRYTFTLAFGLTHSLVYVGYYLCYYSCDSKRPTT